MEHQYVTHSYPRMLLDMFGCVQGVRFVKDMMLETVLCSVCVGEAVRRHILCGSTLVWYKQTTHYLLFSANL